jgi:hypothetical protein
LLPEHFSYDRGQGSLRELARQLREQPGHTLAELQQGLRLSSAANPTTQSMAAPTMGKSVTFVFQTIPHLANSCPQVT